MSVTLDNEVVENWIIDNIIQGLSRKTISFYLEKISSLYTRIASQLTGGREIMFKEIKRKYKELPPINYGCFINRVNSKIHSLVNRNPGATQDSRLVESIFHFPCGDASAVRGSLKSIWACLALKAGVLPSVVKGIIGKVPPMLEMLNLCESKEIDESKCANVSKIVMESLMEDSTKWFAMRLRPKVKFEGLLDRFSRLSEDIKMPELFYPCEEIAKRIGRKMVFTGKPIIRDIVFFKSHRRDIYSLFTKLYDLAWCYRTPGTGIGNYASIPDKAMEDFKKALGFLSPDYEVMPSGQMELKAGDKVVIVDGDYAQEIAQVVKPSVSEDGNKIYRVSLLNRNGHWDLGIDARLLKKT